MQLKDALKFGAVLTPKAHLVHCALAVLGPGEHSIPAVCEVLGYPAEGRGSAKFQTRVNIGARQLKNATRGLCDVGPGRIIIASDAYKPKPAKKAAKKPSPAKVKKVLKAPEEDGNA